MTHREYFFTLDARGNLIHDGAILDDGRFLDMFFGRLRDNDSGRHDEYRYYAPCGPEWNFVACADTPIVFHSFDGTSLTYAHSLRVEFDPTALRFGDNGVMYHAAPLGTWGRLHHNVTLELARNIVPWGPWYAFSDPRSGTCDVIRPLHDESHRVFMPPRSDNACAGCGEGNPYGLRLSFLFDTVTSTSHTWLRPDIRYMGSLGIMHGGYVALLLDETMGKALRGLEVKAPTAQLNVRYRKPVPLHQPLHVSARLVREEGRKFFMHAEIRLEQDPGHVLAECEALFLRIPHNADA